MESVTYASIFAHALNFKKKKKTHNHLISNISVKVASKPSFLFYEFCTHLDQQQKTVKHVGLVKNSSLTAVK